MSDVELFTSSSTVKLPPELGGGRVPAHKHIVYTGDRKPHVVLEAKDHDWWSCCVETRPQAAAAGRPNHRKKRQPDSPCTHLAAVLLKRELALVTRTPEARPSLARQKHRLQTPKNMLAQRQQQHRVQRNPATEDEVERVLAAQPETHRIVQHPDGRTEHFAPPPELAHAIAAAASQWMPSDHELAMHLVLSGRAMSVEDLIREACRAAEKSPPTNMQRALAAVESRRGKVEGILAQFQHGLRIDFGTDHDAWEAVMHVQT